MAKPKHAPLPPDLPIVPLDRFNLPVQWSLLGEMPDETGARKQQVEKLMAALFEVAVSHLGRTAAEAAWKRVAEKKPGRPKGAHRPDDDRVLLAMIKHVQSLGTVPDSEIASHLGNRLNSNHPGKFGQSATAIATHIRRLRKAEQARQRSIKVRSDDLPSLFSFLGTAGQKPHG